MELQEILTAVSTVGFPIVACGAMFWKIHDQDTKHKEEIDKLSQALENNTIAMTRLVDHLEK